MPSIPESRRVYVCDDERVISSTLAIILRNNGYDPTPFHDPREALRQSMRQPPDLLISDVMMPEMSGVELAIQVCDLSPQCEIVLFSSHPATLDLIAQASAKGYRFGVIQKPVHPTELLRMIRQQPHQKGNMKCPQFALI